MRSNYTDHQKYPSYRYASGQPEQINPSLTQSAGKIEPFEYRQPCDDPQGQTESDLCAQWKSANASQENAFWAKWSVWIAGVSTVAVAAAIILTVEANTISRESMEAQGRAWVAIDFIEAVGFRLDNDRPRFVFKVKFENLGPTPAMHFRFFPSLVFGENPSEHIDETIGHFEDGRIDWIEDNMFPNRPLEKPVSCDHEGEPPGLAKTYLYIMACYHTAFSEKLRYTSVLFRIQDARRSDGLIDYRHPPYGEHIRVCAPDEFVGYAT